MERFILGWVLQFISMVHAAMMQMSSEGISMSSEFTWIMEAVEEWKGLLKYLVSKRSKLLQPFLLHSPRSGGRESHSSTGLHLTNPSQFSHAFVLGGGERKGIFKCLLASLWYNTSNLLMLCLHSGKIQRLLKAFWVCLISFYSPLCKHIPGVTYFEGHNLVFPKYNFYHTWRADGGESTLDLLRVQHL